VVGRQLLWRRMKMKSLRCMLVAAVLGLVAAPSFAVNVGGIAWMRASYNRLFYPGAGQSVKLCVDDWTGQGARGKGSATRESPNGPAGSMTAGSGQESGR
jgi:hypothetical protein